MSSYQYRKSHCGDKTVVRSSYLHNGISYTGKMSSLYWIGALLRIMYMYAFVKLKSEWLKFRFPETYIRIRAMYNVIVYMWYLCKQSRRKWLIRLDHLNYKHTPSYKYLWWIHRTLIYMIIIRTQVIRKLSTSFVAMLPYVQCLNQGMNAMHWFFSA